MSVTVTVTVTVTVVGGSATHQTSICIGILKMAFLEILQPAINCVVPQLVLPTPLTSCECGSLTARKCLSCSEYVCDGCWLDHTTTICPAV